MPWHFAVILAPAAVLALTPPFLFPEWSTSLQVRYALAAAIPPVALSLLAWFTRIHRLRGAAWLFVLGPSVLVNVSWALTILSRLRPAPPPRGMHPYEIQLAMLLPPLLQVLGTAVVLSGFYLVVAGIPVLLATTDFDAPRRPPVAPTQPPSER